MLLVNTSLFQGGVELFDSVAPNTTEVKTIVFDKAFSAAPVVVASHMMNNAQNFCVSVRSFSATDFELRVHSAHTLTTPVRVSWIAVGSS